MSNAYAQRLRLRLFLEGVEIPVISATVRAVPNSPAIASIQVPPLAEGTKLLPRTTVHLYFLDLYQNLSPFLQTLGPNNERSAARSPTAYEQSRRRRDEALEELDGGSDKEAELLQTVDNALVDMGNEQYKLLFGGEIVGFQWTKNVVSRGLVLQCEDWSNYWDYAYQWNNTGLFGPGIKALFSGGATNLFDDVTGLTSKGAEITRVVTSGRCNSFPNLEGMAAGIIRLLEAIGGIYYPKPREGQKPISRVSGQNVFFSLAELRLHLTHMIAAYEADPTSKRLLSRHGYSGMFNRALGGQGGQTSYRMAVNALTKIIFYETYPQPCPYYKPGSEGQVSGSARIKFKDDPHGVIPVAKAGAIIEVLEELKNLISNLEQDREEVGSTIPAAVKKTFKETQLKQVREISKKLESARTSLRQELTTMGTRAPATAKSAFGKAINYIATAVQALSKWVPGAPEKARNAVTGKMDLAIVQLKRVEDLTISTTPLKQQVPARLNQQVLRPDIWFGAPPRCNVLFPEDYESLQYQRAFLQEPTRFLLKTNDELLGENFLLDRFYFAPRAGNIDRDKARLQDMMRNRLLDHELFTGILPVFEKMGEFNIFSASAGQSRTDIDKVGLAQRSANFLYFKHRFNARRMRLNGKFNPYVAVGFPGLVIDKYVDREVIALHNQLIESANRARSKDDQLRPTELSEILGTNFMGSFTEVEHVISQEPARGSTSITLSYPRQIEETVEFLGIEETERTVRQRVEGDAKRATDVAAINPPKLYSLGPNGGRITNVHEVTDLYLRNATIASQVTTEAGRLLPLFDRSIGRRTEHRKATLVPIGQAVTAEDFNDPSLAEILGEEPVVFRAYRLDEELPRYQRQSVDLPIEELIRPSWYGDVWTNSKIGKVYEDFFGIGSITDKQVITDPYGASFPAVNERAAQAAEEQETSEDAEDPMNEAPAVLALNEKATIQQAAEFLLLTYSHIRQQGMDVNEFLHAYKWRPIASMVDLFGTSDLQFKDTGEAVIQGIEGFHSRAFGPYDNVFGLVGPDLEDIVNIKRGSPAAQRADTRRRKLEQVQTYVSALKFSRALLG